MFIGREKELEALNRLYSSDKFEFAVIYGRWRVGKTSLISRFIGDKKAIYFIGVESNAKQNLDNFSKSIIDYIGGEAADMSFVSFQAALEYVLKLSEKERIILAIDEYPYVAHSSKSLASTLQLLIDKYRDNSRLMLILCGSSMSYMEDEVLAYKAPLYGRHTAQIKLQPFGFEEACRYLKRFSDEDKALLYGAVGGTPQYLLQIDEKLSFEENIKNIYLNPASFLFEEPLNLLRQGVREAAAYTAVITAIAAGASRLSEISDKIGEKTNACAGYTKKLLTLGMIRKELPYGESTSRKAVYCIEDNMFRFWYRFVLENSSIIARGAAEIAYDRMKPFFSEYMGSVFEEICKQYLWKLLLDGKCPVAFSSLGRWWGNDSVRKCHSEIGIMGEQDKNTALFAECKWTDEKVSDSVLETLLTRSEIFPYKNNHYFLFAKAGFTNSCIDNAKKLGNVALVTYKDIIKSFNIDDDDPIFYPIRRFQK